MKEVNVESVGFRIGQWIMINDLTKKQFADQTGMNHSQLHRIIRGDGVPGFENLLRIKKTFPDISLTWLVYGEGNPTAPDDNEWGLLQALRAMEPDEQKKLRSQLSTRWFEDQEIDILTESLAGHEGITTELRERIFGRLYIKHIERRGIALIRDDYKSGSRTSLVEYVNRFMKREDVQNHPFNKINNNITNFCSLKSKEAKDLLKEFDK